MSMIATKHIVLAGLAGGVVLNLIDTPWSVFVMLSKMQAFEAAHGLTASPWTGPWFMAVHFAYMIAIAWLYAHLRASYGAGTRTALIAGGVLFGINRLFGIGNGFLGVLPFDLFWGFTIGFAVGSLLGSLVVGRLIERAVPAHPQTAR